RFTGLPINAGDSNIASPLSMLLQRVDVFPLQQHEDEFCASLVETRLEAAQTSLRHGAELQLSGGSAESLQATELPAALSLTPTQRTCSI
ncbi:hypothetical protein GBF38_006578, partial [Nibea albiflora]